MLGEGEGRRVFARTSVSGELSRLTACNTQYVCAVVEPISWACLLTVPICDGLVTQPFSPSLARLLLK